MWKLFSNGTTALVTGSSRGIGRQIAIELAKQGVDVAVNYNSNEEKAQELVKELEEYGVKAIAIKADMSKQEEVGEMFKIVKKEFGHLSILVNNAGIIKDGYLMMMSEATFLSVIDTNLMGCFRTTQEAIRIMCKQKEGKIVNISSTSGIVGQEGQTNYSASKGGIIAFTKAVSKEYAKYNIRCNAVAPGFIDTDMTAKKGSGTSLQEKYTDLISMKRFGTTEEVANSVLFLLSDQASYITGKVLTVDGGLIE